MSAKSETTLESRMTETSLNGALSILRDQAHEIDRLRELLNACWEARYNADAIDALVKGSGIRG